MRVIAVAIFALLFAQWSVASYVCPSPSTWESDVMAGMDFEGMANEMDPASPNLCAEHCKYGEQGDQLRPPTVPAVSLTSLYVVPLDSTITESSEEKSTSDLTCTCWYRSVLTPPTDVTRPIRIPFG